jgi:hypothetical protein
VYDEGLSSSWSSQDQDEGARRDRKDWDLRGIKEGSAEEKGATTGPSPEAY